MEVVGVGIGIGRLKYSRRRGVFWNWIIHGGHIVRDFNWLPFYNR